MSAFAFRLAAAAFSILHLTTAFYTRFFIKASVLKLALKAIQLNLFLKRLEGLLKIISDLNLYRQGYPPFLCGLTEATIALRKSICQPKPLLQKAHLIKTAA